MSTGALGRLSARLDGVAAYFLVAGAVQIGFFLGRYLIAAIVSPDTFGRWDAVLGLGSLLGIVLTAGLHGAVMHYVAVHRDERREQQRYVSSALALQVTLALAAVAGGAIAYLALGDESVIGFNRDELAAAGAVGLGTAGPTVLAASLLGRRVRRPLVVANVLRLTALGALVAVLALATGRRQVSTIALGWAIGGALQTVILLRASYPLVRARAVDRTAAVASLRYGAGAFVHTAAGWLLIACDRVVLKANVSAAHLGRYGLAYLIAFSYEQLFSITNQLALPRMYDLMRDEERADDLVTVLRSALLAVTLCATAFVAVVPTILPAVAPREFGDLSALVAVLASAVFWSGAYTALVNILFFHHKVAVLAATTVVSAVVGVVPILFLVDRFGVMSAAGATLAGYIVHFASVAAVARRLFPRTPVLFPSVTGTCVVALAVSQTAALDGLAAVVTAAVAGAVISVVVVAEIRRLDFEVLRRIVSGPPREPMDDVVVEPG